MTAFFLFLAGLAAFVVAWLRKTAGQTAALDAAEKKAEEAEATVEEKREDLKALDKAAEAAHIAVEARLAELDRHLARDRERDTVDVANEVIRRN